MDVTGLIDKRNFELWNSLNSIHDIEIIEQQRVDYLTYSKDDKSIIYVPFDNKDAASFTHELLHIFLRKKNVFIGGGLTLGVGQSQTLSRILSENLVQHIGNCLEHIKMLPEFIKLGFTPNEFLADYSINKLTDEETAEIKKYFLVQITPQKIYFGKTIDLFIGKYFSVKACPNKSFSYEKNLAELKKIDTPLYQVLDDFLNEWIKYDYNDTNPLTGGYHLFSYDFIDNLEKWTEGKMII